MIYFCQQKVVFETTEFNLENIMGFGLWFWLAIVINYGISVMILTSHCKKLWDFGYDFD